MNYKVKLSQIMIGVVLASACGCGFMAYLLDCVLFTGTDILTLASLLIGGIGSTRYALTA